MNGVQSRAVFYQVSSRLFLTIELGESTIIFLSASSFICLQSGGFSAVCAFI